MGWWKLPTWVTDPAAWWRAVREVEPDLATPKEVANSEGGPPTVFVEVKREVEPPGGGKHGEWQSILVGACGWVPGIRDGDPRISSHPFSWEPCPGCGEHHLYETVARPWVSKDGKKWWEFRR